MMLDAPGGVSLFLKRHPLRYVARVPSLLSKEWNQ